MKVNQEADKSASKANNTDKNVSNVSDNTDSNISPQWIAKKIFQTASFFADPTGLTACYLLFSIGNDLQKGKHKKKQKLKVSDTAPIWDDIASWLG